MIVNIGNLTFKTKKECEEYTRNYIKKLGCCIIKPDNIHFKFFYDLLNNHSEYIEKKGIGIKYFSIIKNIINKNAFHINIIRLDNTSVPFSWIFACKNNNINLLNRALRESISKFIIDFRLNSNLICKKCKTTKGDFEIDHIINFCDLKQSFLNEYNGKIPDSFKHCKKTYNTIFKESDKDFKDAWFKYHKDNCILQVLCVDCHKQKNNFK